MKKLIEGLHDFKKSYYCSHQDLFEQISRGQKPRVLFITCSDSRIDPNLITQTDLGELFVIRNAGNIIPPFGATNGGEGAAVEYAIHALGIQEVIVCGHSHCGAMKGLLKLPTLAEDMPLVHKWLEHAEPTRRVLKENYSNLEGEELVELAVAENVLAQLDNLRTYPAIRSRMHKGQLNLYGWIYQIETGDVLAFDPDTHQFNPIHDNIIVCDIPNHQHVHAQPVTSQPITSQSIASQPNIGNIPSWLSPEQAERIYRGSYSH